VATCGTAKRKNEMKKELGWLSPAIIKNIVNVNLNKSGDGAGLGVARDTLGGGPKKGREGTAVDGRLVGMRGDEG
jgi:hypothetical protein